MRRTKPVLTWGAMTKSASPLIENKAQMIDRLASGNKPRDEWRIGTEHEKIGFCLETRKPLPYFGDCSVKTMLDGLQR